MDPTNEKWSPCEPIQCELCTHVLRDSARNAIAGVLRKRSSHRPYTSPRNLSPCSVLHIEGLQRFCNYLKLTSAYNFLGKNVEERTTARCTSAGPTRPWPRTTTSTTSECLPYFQTCRAVYRMQSAMKTRCALLRFTSHYR